MYVCIPFSEFLHNDLCLTLKLCVSAESGGADAEIADNEGCWPRVLLSSRYLSLFSVTLVPLTKTYKQDTENPEPCRVKVTDLT